MYGDLHNTVRYQRAIAPPAAAQTDNTAIVTTILDRADFGAVELVLVSGNLADADVTTTVLLEESDAANMSGANTVADVDLLGTRAGAQLNFSNDNATAKLGYKGTKRYLRATITPANNTGAFVLAGIWALGVPRTVPQSAQIV